MRTILTAIAIGISLIVQAQINVGSNAISSFNRAGKLSKEDIEDLKGTTTLFTLQYSDYNRLQEFEKVIGDVWTVTKFKIIKPNEIGQYSHKDGYSFFAFGGYYVSSKNGSQLHLSYDLWTPEVNKKGKVKDQDYYSRILLYPDERANMKARVTPYSQFNNKFSEKMLSYVYNEALFFNWGPGFLKGYLKTVNDFLVAGETRGLSIDDKDDDELPNLKKDTLYVPDYVNITYQPFVGAVNKNDQENESEEAEDVKGIYPYPIKYIPAAQLNDMLVNRTSPFYYLVFVRSSSDKYVDVYSSGKGLIYSRFKKLSYNFKDKDLGKLANAIK